MAERRADPDPDDDGAQERQASAPGQLIFGEDDGRYVVVAPQGGRPTHPHWYLNLSEPRRRGPGQGDRFAHARTAEGAERERLWQQMAQIWPPYDDYQRKTDCRISVVVRRPGGDCAGRARRRPVDAEPGSASTGSPGPRDEGRCRGRVRGRLPPRRHGGRVPQRGRRRSGPAGQRPSAGGGLHHDEAVERRPGRPTTRPAFEASLARHRLRQPLPAASAPLAALEEWRVWRSSTPRGSRESDRRLELPRAASRRAARGRAHPPSGEPDRADPIPLPDTTRDRAAVPRRGRRDRRTPLRRPSPPPPPPPDSRPPRGPPPGSSPLPFRKGFFLLPLPSPRLRGPPVLVFFLPPGVGLLSSRAPGGYFRRCRPHGSHARRAAARAGCQRPDRRSPARSRARVARAGGAPAHARGSQGPRGLTYAGRARQRRRPAAGALR